MNQYDEDMKGNDVVKVTIGIAIRISHAQSYVRKLGMERIGSREVWIAVQRNVGMVASSLALTSPEPPRR